MFTGQQVERELEEGTMRELEEGTERELGGTEQGLEGGAGTEFNIQATELLRGEMPGTKV